MQRVLRTRSGQQKTQGVRILPARAPGGGQKAKGGKGLARLGLELGRGGVSGWGEQNERDSVGARISAER